ncbi:MAG: leucine--tRNA ligase [Candidatus Magasanikbacteria bacterium]
MDTKTMEYDHKKIEQKWQDKWEEEGIYEPNLENPQDPFYNLMMFPYPSAKGLHVGNMYAFTGSDVYGRFQRMQGKDVFEPIGLDGFGIHSENYAIKVDTHPVEQSKKSEKNFYEQLKMVGNGFSWEERLETYKPEYYKWTQWIFIQMYKNGLAYRDTSSVKWCPGCKTVLADEQVIKGECERCDSEAEQKELRQWFFKITDYADRLLEDLKDLDWSERVKNAQKNWIGKSKGATIPFKVKGVESNEVNINVFTTRPDTLFGATYLALAPEHELIERIKKDEIKVKNKEEVLKYVNKIKSKTEEQRKKDADNKTGIKIKGLKAKNPANGEKLPVFAAEYVLKDVGSGAIMAVPAHDERDFAFAKKHDVSIKQVISKGDGENNLEEAYEGKGTLINSSQFNGLSAEEAKEEITNYVGGEKTENYKLRDWLISRQRYWGPPIPIIYCNNCWKNNPQKDGLEKGVDYDVIDGEKCMIHTVEEDNLPVELPYIEDFKPKGVEVSPLGLDESFVTTECPECGSEAKRETDVSDNFLDSAWYYYRYPSLNSENSQSQTPKNNKRVEIPWNKKVNKNWLPVDMYIGGAEHAVLHLLYTRFITKVFYDWDLIDFKEPFKKFRAHGLLIKEGQKMSKSVGNVVNPEEYINKFGADVLRTYLMFLAPFEEGGDFRDEGILGITRFLDRIWKLKNRVSEQKNLSEKLQRKMHRTIKKAGEDIQSLQYNTAIAALMELEGEVRDLDEVPQELYENLLKMLAPFSPHLVEEIWREDLDKNNSIHEQSWPEYEDKKTKKEDFELVVQINGEFRDKVRTNKGISKEKAQNLAESQEKIKKYLQGNEVEKVIFVEDTLINFVIPDLN